MTRARARRRRVSAHEARRWAIAAQGLSLPRPERAPTARDVRRAIDRIRLLQIDSINVLVRAHYLPIFSRLGPYDRAILDRLAYERRELYEAWAHAATILPVRFHRLLRWRSERKAWPALQWIRRKSPQAVEDVVRRIETAGPVAASDLPHGKGKGSWWGWGDGKHILEWLFASGRVTTSSRRNFERVYDLVERVLPSDVLGGPTPSREDAQRELLLESADALGVATANDLADYFRLHRPTSRRLVAGLAGDGRLEAVEVEGWREPGFVLPGRRVPRVPECAGRLLSPFDSLLFDRARTERLFGFRYRIEVYTPAARRTFGYYVLPFLLEDDLVARVDLKADRAAGRLEVRTAHIEAGREAERVAPPLAREIREMARWLGLPEVRVGRRGGLCGPLRAALCAPVEDAAGVWLKGDPPPSR